MTGLPVGVPRALNLWRESPFTAISSSRLGNLPRPCNAKSLDPAFSDRFEYIRRLGSGGFGSVWEVVDRTTNGRVALKVLERTDGRSVLRFKREFRALSDLRHPNLVSLFELFEQGNAWAFSMELVQGVPFSSAICQNPARTPDLLTKLMEGLSFLHSHGFVHRDIKPSNVLVGEDGPQLLDFGMAMLEMAAVDVQSGTIVSGATQQALVRFAGTRRYAAPELLAGGSATRASDVYSTGIMVLEALAEAEQLSAFSTIVELSQRMIATDPAERPTTAEVLKLLGAPVQKSMRVSDVPLLGRSNELDALAATFRHAKTGRPAIAIVSGAAGLGKSTLLGRFVARIRRADPTALVLTSRCHPRESVPFKTVDGLIDGLADVLAGMPPSEREMLCDVESDLGQIFPVLAPFVGSHTTATLVAGLASHSLAIDRDRFEARRQALDVLRALLCALSVRGPLVWVLDDLHHGDRDGVAVLVEILREPDPPPLILVVSHREGEGVQLVETLRGAALKADIPCAEISVEPLSAADAAVVLQTHYPDASADDLSRAVEEAAGNPLLLEQLAMSLVAFGAGSLHSMNEGLIRRVDGLGRSARRALELLCIAGRPLPRGMLFRAALLSTDRNDALIELENAHLVKRTERGFNRADPNAARVEEMEPYHERIRDAVVREIGAVAAAALHLRLARFLESEPNPDFEAIADHLVSACEPWIKGQSAEIANGGKNRSEEMELLARARVALKQAGQRSHQALAFERAARIFARIVDLSPDPLAADWVLLGEAHANAGHGPDAAFAFSRAAMATEGIRRLTLRRRAAEQLMACGHLDAGSQAMRMVFLELDLEWPTSDAKAMGTTILERARLAFQVGLPSASETNTNVLDDRTQEQIDALCSASSSYATYDPLMGAALQAQHIRHALLAGDSIRIVRALTLEVPFQFSLRGANVARELLGDLQVRTSKLATVEALALYELAVGLLATLESRFDDARLPLRNALERLRSTPGLRWAENTAASYALLAHRVAGDFAFVDRELPRLLSSAQARGDLGAEISLRVQVGAHHALRHDRPDQARRELESVQMLVTEERVATKALPFRLLPDFHAWIESMLVELYVGNVGMAHRLLERRFGMFSDSPIARIPSARIVTEYYRGIIARGVGKNDQRKAASLALARERGPWAGALRAVLDDDLSDAEKLFRTCGTPVHVDATLAIRGDRAALERIRSRGIVAPERYISTIMPMG